MCGLALTISGSLHEVVKMGNTIHRRGVKSNITELDNIKVYFTWLPITDPRDENMQPFKYKSLYVWMNGYISNYRELARKYHLPTKTECDTEVLVMLLYGRNNASTWSELNGFFSVATYDIETKEIKCFTDRYGIKQLYEYKSGNTTYIASEPKALLSVMHDRKFDDGAVSDWLHSLGVMTDHTIFEGIKRIGQLPFIKPQEQDIEYDAAKGIVSHLLQKSFARNKVKGIYDCVFLSGGVDSGIIAKYMNAKYSFSVDYQDSEYSENENIRANSRSLHYSIICNQSLFHEYIPKIFNAIDDLKVGSCYTNYAITEFASKMGCTVIYSGAGGDEVFDGYSHRYDKPLEKVIKRTDFISELPFVYDGLTHKEYDWRYLKGILVVEDRMAGYHTMETRYPLLDNDLVDFVLSLPKEYRENKRILKDVCALDPKVVNGKKRGFCNPYLSNDEWARFALKSIKEKYHIP